MKEENTYIGTHKQRLKWVDYAKCFSIFLVVSFHTPHKAEGYLGEILQLLRMPAFFMISGLLYRMEKYPSVGYFIKHRSIQLLVPYFFFFLIFYILWLAGGRNWIGGNDMECSIWQPLFEFVYGTPYLIIAPYWFVCCLFSIQIIYYLSIKYLPRPLALFFFFISPILCSFDIFQNLPWNISNALLYIPLYALANQCKDFIKEIHTKHILPASIMLLVVLVGTYYKEDYPPIANNLLNTIYSILIIPAYVLFIKAISHIKADKLAQFIGKNTIIILALQNYFIGTMKLTFPSLIEEGNILTNIIMTMLNISFCCIPIYFINRYTPFIVGRGAYFENKLKINKK